MTRLPPLRSKARITFLSGAYALPCRTAFTAPSRTAIEICMISSSGKPNSVAIRVAFSSAWSIVSSEESSVYETRCSVMAMGEEQIEYKTDYKTTTADEPASRLSDARRKPFPANAVVCLSDGRVVNDEMQTGGFVASRQRYNLPRGPALATQPKSPPAADLSFRPPGDRRHRGAGLQPGLRNLRSKGNHETESLRRRYG